MLAAHNRLRDRRAIAEVMRRGRPVGTGTVLIKSRANHLADSRVVVVVSKKISKKAVVRNRLRRRLAAVLAEEWATVPSGYDIVVSVRSDLSAASAAELSRTVKATLQRAGLSGR